MLCLPSKNQLVLFNECSHEKCGTKIAHLYIFFKMISLNAFCYFVNIILIKIITVMYGFYRTVSNELKIYLYSKDDNRQRKIGIVINVVYYWLFY